MFFFFFVGDKLEEFLRSLNSSKPLYLGQTGLGNIEELGKLGLEPGENFCMGGPGMIFSREVLRRMVPHIGECLREMYTTHEDVEVGRCVRRFGGTQCVWSYEVRLELWWKCSRFTGRWQFTVWVSDSIYLFSPCLCVCLKLIATVSDGHKGYCGRGCLRAKVCLRFSYLCDP